MRLALALFVLLLSAPPLAAQEAQCRRDLARASALIEEVHRRAPQFPTIDPYSRANKPLTCALLRQNHAALAAASVIMDRCLTGHERSKDRGQILNSIGDIDAAIAEICR
ncbi:MAG TPA: hypothetical protein VKS78_18600 [Roseiarcus sp.]|nr:hypothetical protein [Roseiarcus sp.]